MFFKLIESDKRKESNTSFIADEERNVAFFTRFEADSKK